VRGLELGELDALFDTKDVDAGTEDTESAGLVQLVAQAVKEDVGGGGAVVLFRVDQASGKADSTKWRTSGG
jgi:hypothetical protein